MKDGFIKVAAPLTELSPADCQENAERIISCVAEAAEDEVRIAVFPELCVSGSTCGDLFRQRSLIEAAREALLKIVRRTMRCDVLLILGAPLLNGGLLYNCLVAAYHGKVLGVVPKRNLTAEERRYFSDDLQGLTEIGVGGKAPFGKNLIFYCEGAEEFDVCPVHFADFAGADRAAITAVCGADYERVDGATFRRRLAEAYTSLSGGSVVMSFPSAGESTGEGVCSGYALIAENGRALCERKPFETVRVTMDTDVQYMRRGAVRGDNIPFAMPVQETKLTRIFKKNPFIPVDKLELERRCEFILHAQAQGLAARLTRAGVKKAVVGVSGGLDSALAVVACAAAARLAGLEARDVIAVTMPCFGTTARTRANAQQLCLGLDTDFRTVDITQAVKVHFADIGQPDDRYDAAYENAQARERTQVLMDIANRENGLAVGTGDMSEAALGWTTFGGDHLSMYNVNASLPKTLMRKVAEYYAAFCDNEAVKQALTDILDTPVSPELLPPEDGAIAQRTEKLVGPYDLHDFFLYYAVGKGFAPDKIYRMACRAFYGEFEPKVVSGWLKVFYKRFFAQQFKRGCAPDGVGLGSVSLSPRTGWKMPSDAVADGWLRCLEELE